MNRKLLIIILIILFLISLSIHVFAFNASFDENVKAMLIYDSPIDIESIEQQVNDSMIRIEGFHSVTNVEGRVYNSMYLVNQNSSFKEAIEDFRDQRYHALIEGIHVVEQKLKALDENELRESVETVLNDLKIRKEALEQDQEVKIITLIVSGKKNDLDYFKEQNKLNITFIK
jgi:hypothetical protein